MPRRSSSKKRNQQRGTERMLRGTPSADILLPPSSMLCHLQIKMFVNAGAGSHAAFPAYFNNSLKSHARQGNYGKNFAGL